MHGPQRESAVHSLQQMFPALERAVIADALRACNGNVDEAVGRLLDAAPGFSAPHPASKAQHRPGRVHGRPAQPMGWSAFTAQLHQKPAASHATAGGKAAALADPTAFPQLSPGGLQPLTSDGRGWAQPGWQLASAGAPAAQSMLAEQRHPVTRFDSCQRSTLGLARLCCRSATTTACVVSTTVLMMLEPPVACMMTFMLLFPAGCAVGGRAARGRSRMDAIRAAGAQHAGRGEPCRQPRRQPFSQPLRQPSCQPPHLSSEVCSAAQASWRLPTPASPQGTYATTRVGQEGWECSRGYAGCVLALQGRRAAADPAVAEGCQRGHRGLCG